MTQIIIGECPSKSNSYKIIRCAGHGKLCKTPKLTDYEKTFYLQCNHYRKAMIKGLFELHINVYFTSNSHDLDNCLKIILDCLQKIEAIKNDNNCVRIDAAKYIDKLNPRIEFSLIQV